MSQQKRKEILGEVRSAVVERTVTLLLAGFGFVAALAWNEAVQALVREFFPLSRTGTAAKFVYAAVVTVILVILSLRLAKLTKKE